MTCFSRIKHKVRRLSWNDEVGSYDFILQVAEPSIGRRSLAAVEGVYSSGKFALKKGSAANMET